MTKAAQLLARLRALDVKLSVEGDGLRSSAPRGVLTPELQKELTELKPEIIALLKATDNAGHLAARPARMIRHGDVPLSFAQQRLWFLDQLESGSPAYTIAVRRRLHGPLATDTLARAFTELVRRHEALRTTFVTKDGQPIQQIHDPYPVTLPIIDLTGAAEDPSTLEAHLRAEAERPFDLARGPLFRSVLLRVGPEEHELLLAVHHIVADGWSLGILAREVHALYEAYAAGRPSPLPEPPLQYADFALWQRQWLQGSILEGQRRYWLDRLGEGLAPVELLTDHERPRRPELAGASHDFALPQPLADRLRALSRREGATLFMTLLAALNVLLSRYSGRQDIVVGTPVANRNHTELEAVVGFFVNTLVLRTDLTGDPTFRQLLARVREVSLGAFSHQDMPFEKLVEELHPDRSLGLNPLFQTSFVFQTVTTGAGLDFVTLASVFDLTLFVADRGEGALGATIEYRPALFEPDTIVRLAEHFQTLLAAAAADPDRPISRLPLMESAAMDQLLVGWNATAISYPRHHTIHQLFEEQVDAAPDAVAVIMGSASMTYRELDRRANRLAHHLRALGVGPERLVGIWMERSIDMVVAVLGVLKAGGAYTPFDLLSPRERLAYMLEDAKVDVLLTQERLLSRLPEHRGRTVCLDDGGGEAAWGADTRPEPTGSEQNLAYVMYTSGSTGDPKGVAVTHRSVVRLVKNANYASFGPEHVFLQLAPLSFDASTFEIWGSLLNGGRLAIAPPGVLSLEELGTVLDRYGVTTLWLTAGLFHQVVDRRIDILRPVRQLLAGGDVLSLEHVRRVLAAHPRCRIINGYGPTEGTTFTCCHEVDRTRPLKRSVPIGRPIANTRVYVLDRTMQAVPVGVPGELWIAGDGLARGYVNRPDLTAERFLHHRFSETLEERLYRTGDLVRWLSDGTLEFLGRLDDQIKLRGYRVEPGEIEATLMRHHRMRDAAVVVRPSPDGDRHLVAYLVTDGTIPPRDLREFLKDKLPEYMVPSAFVTLDALPLTTNGKLNRRALPEPEAQGTAAETSMEPADDVERQLLRIWQEVLAVSSIGPRDNFFDVGGHSLLAVRLFARIQAEMGTTLPLATLFQAPTVQGLAALIRRGGQPGAWRSLVAIQPAGSRPPVFAIPGVGGNVLGYSDLARLMAPDQPLYALQSRGLDGSEEPFTRIEHIAAHFLQEIRRVQPDGPYYLIGACMGGVVAYETAQQIRAAGHAVGLLALLETWPPVNASGRFLTPGGRALLDLMMDRLRLTIRMLSQLRGRRRFQYLLDRMKVVGQMVARRDAFRGDRSELYLRLVTQANLLALQQYEPRVYPGRAVLFRAEGRVVAATDDRRLAWRQLTTGGLEVCTVPGDDSGTMLEEPHVRMVASHLKEHLERAQASPVPLGNA